MDESYADSPNNYFHAGRIQLSSVPQDIIYITFATLYASPGTPFNRTSKYPNTASAI